MKDGGQICDQLVTFIFGFLKCVKFNTDVQRDGYGALRLIECKNASINKE